MNASFAAPAKSRLLSRLFACYEEAGVNYCLLRNYENLPLQVDARDIDILVQRSHRDASRKAIAMLVQDGAAVLYHQFSDERFDQYYILLKNDPEGEVQELKIDCFFDSELYGVRLLAGDAILATRRRYRDFYVAEPLYMFLDKWLFGYLLGAELPARYHEGFRRICIEEQDKVRAILAPLLGTARAQRVVAYICNVGFARDMERIPRSSLFLVLLKQAARSPFFHGGHLLHFVHSRVRHLLHPKGEFISLSGPDGSGKTTVLEHAGKRLRVLFPYSASGFGHFRPAALPRIATLLKRSGAIEVVDENYAEPHRGKPSGFAGSLLRFSYYSLDYVWGYFTKIRPALVRRELVIYDRYFFDMVADQGRSRIELPRWIRKLVLRILPMPHTALFVEVSPQIVRERKQELSLERIAEINAAYRDLAASGHMVVLENDGPLEMAISALVSQVISRRRARLGLDRK